MIVESIFNALFLITSSLFNLLPGSSWVIPQNVLTTVESILQTCCYFLPMDTVIIILGIVYSINLFKIFISFLKTFWDILPIV